MELVYKDSSGKKARLSMTDTDEVLIGRHRDCNLRTDNPSVSRRHARITANGDSWFVEDLKSSNHTFVNGEEITKASFRIGDTVRCGEFVMKVEEGMAPARPTRSPPAAEAPAADSVQDRRSRRTALEEDRERRRRERAERRAKQHGKSEEASDEGLEFAEVAPEALPADPEPKLAASAPSEESPQTGRKRALDERRARRRASSDSIDSALGSGRRRSAREVSAPNKAMERDLREAKEQVGSLKRDLAESQVRVDELKLRVHELEQREARHEEELDGWHDRYNRAREQVDHVQELLEETREELKEVQSRVEEFESQVVDLEGNLSSVEARQSEEAALLSELKTKVVQKDRRIDELQRELDLMEYDLRGAREELESLQDSFNQDNSQQRQLEREMELLREIIREKENVIVEKNLEIEDQGREIYDLKMGTGVKDLEQAKNDVLEQFFEKNRECDELTEKLKETRRDVEELNTQIEELEGRLSDSKDITEHPDYQRKMREVERAQADVEEAKEAYTSLEERLEGFGPEAKGKLDAQINFLERKNTALQEKLDAARDSIEELKLNVAEDTPTINVEPEDAGTTGQVGREAVARARALEKHSLVSELFQGWRSNLKLLHTYMEELSDTITEEGDVDEALDSVNEVLAVLRTDSKEMRTELREMETVLTE